ncbi:helix-turn-helix transcriptional regulator [Pseudanabaena sp. FACHB-2040]|uniref:helix-turn-helix domain-containing protein n=1 Tax=Pseudanabaena sp. FACHB-2040 TaxID=2692859 RepID=UPI001684D9FB|nr:helix-turn-helix transcriptional regulator [Pseudanabaena sp. FACHB-2040]MBD2261115.1 helix-turn-helix domain-containing protein [Pseudanabaena sp. FACHB-2040]
MRVRRVQELNIPDLSDRLLAARKASRHSLLEICRRLDITPTYWYKLEKGEASTVNYDLLKRIEDILSLDLRVDFSDASDFNFNKELKMDLSRLKWIKVVTPEKGWPHHWAVSLNEIADCKEPIIQKNGLTILPLGFKHKKAELPAANDLMVLTQHAKVTHVVEFLDDEPYEEGGWFHRYVKIVWWKPEIDWAELPHRKEVLGFDVSIQKSMPYEFSSFESFQEAWNKKGGLEAFQEYVAEQLMQIPG